MKIDDLKKTWQSASKPDTLWTNQQLLEATRGKSKSIIGRLKRNLWFEIILTDGCILVLTYTAIFLKQGPLRWLMVAMLASCVLLGYYLVKKMQVLAGFDFGADNLKNNLEELIKKFDSFLRTYRAAYILSLCVFYVLGLLAVLIEWGPDQFLDKMVNGKGLPFIGLFTATIAVSLLAVDWYIRFLYGKHVAHLRQLLQEISAADDPTEIRLAM